MAKFSLRPCLLALLLTLPACGMLSGQAGAAADPHRAYAGRASDNGSIGLQLLEAPKNRMDDPRARAYIVDHVNPGTAFTRRLRVNSSSPKPQRVEVYAAAADIEKGKFTFEPDRTPNELTSWIKLNRDAVDLPPYGRAEVKATIDVPKRATRGERYAVIWAQVSTAPTGGKGGIALVNRVGVRTYLDVGPGGEPPTTFQIGEVVPHRLEDGRPQVTAVVRNTGERAIDVDGELTLTDGPGGVQAGPFRIVTGTTLGVGQTGTITVNMDTRLPDGPWKFDLRLHSGRVEHAVTGTLTFPEKGQGRPAVLDSPLAMIGLAGLVAMAALGAFVFASRRRRTARADAD